MEEKDFKLDIFYDKDLNSYKFVLDYGSFDNAYCSINENNSIFVSLGDESSLDDETYEKRKQDMLESFMIELFGNNAEYIIECMFTENEPSAFEKVEKFIMDNDSFVQKDENIDMMDDDLYELDSTSFKEDSEEYISMCVYDEGIGSVDFYIKSKIFDDEMGIKINSDGSFYPVISTKYINLTDEAIEMRKSVIKEFIYETLKVKIEFGTLADDRQPRIQSLIEKAVQYAKENGTVQYTDDNNDISTYKNGGEKLTELKGVNKI